MNEQNKEAAAGFGVKEQKRESAAGFGVKEQNKESAAGSGVKEQKRESAAGFGVKEQNKENAAGFGVKEQKREVPAASIARERSAIISRKTKETDIVCALSLDGTGDAQVRTGIGFLDHMLDGFARHGLFDLEMTCEGDLYVDCHHTIEDCGIVLGQALREAMGDKKGMLRYGSFVLPMDEALVLCAVDFGGRPYLGFDYGFKSDRVGYFDTEMVREFFYAVSYSAMMNLHFDIMRGENAHHIIEAMFKAFAKATDIAVTIDPRITDILSTKGML